MVARVAFDGHDVNEPRHQGSRFFVVALIRIPGYSRITGSFRTVKQDVASRMEATSNRPGYSCDDITPGLPRVSPTLPDARDELEQT